MTDSQGAIEMLPIKQTRAYHTRGAELGRKRKLFSIYPSHKSGIMLKFDEVLYGFAVCGGAIEGDVAYMNNEESRPIRGLGFGPTNHVIRYHR